MAKKTALKAAPAGDGDAVHFFEAFTRMLAFLDSPNAATRREFYGLLLSELMSAGGCDEGSLLLAWPSGQTSDLRLEAAHGVATELWAGETGAAPDSASAECLRTGKPVERHGAFGHSLALPLVYRDEVLGVAVLARNAACSPDVLSAAVDAAHGLSQVLKAFQSLTGRRQAEQRLTAILNAGVALQRDHELGAVLDRIIREAEALVDAEAGSVFLRDPEGGLHAPVATGAGGERLRDIRLAKGEGVVGWVAEHGEPALVADAQNDKRFAKRVDRVTAMATRTLLAVPILLDGRLLGVLEVVNKRGGGRFHADEVAPLQALALLAGVAIEGARLMEALTLRARRLDVEVARATVEANESRNRLESVLFAMEDSVIAADENGLATLLNRSAQVLTYELTQAEALGRPLTELLPSTHFAHALQDVRASGTPCTIELELGLDVRRAYAMVLAPIRDLEGYLTGFVVVLRDITRFRELERMKTAFLNTVSHELRTPITSIRAFSELMARKDAEPAKAREWSAVINEEAERLNRLVDDLLDVSRIESGKRLSVVKRPVELKPLVDRSLALFLAQSAHPLKLSLNADLTLAELDPDRFEQILTNLVSNAVKYSPQGGPVEVRVDFAPPESLRVEVQDHGLGLKDDDKAHIFDKFYRVEGAHMQGIRGTGLGLSITKYLVEAHGGRMGVDSVFGEGSTFWFELPLFQAPEKKA